MWSGKISAQPLEIQLLASLLTKKRLRNAKFEQRPRFKEWHWCWWHVLCILWGMHFELQCMCVESEGGCQIQFLFHSLPPCEQCWRGEVMQPISENPNKTHFPERDQTLYPFPVSTMLFVTEMGNCKYHRRRGKHSFHEYYWPLSRYQALLKQQCRKKRANVL